MRKSRFWSFTFLGAAISSISLWADDSYPITLHISKDSAQVLRDIAAGTPNTQNSGQLTFSMGGSRVGSTAIPAGGLGGVFGGREGIAINFPYPVLVDALLRNANKLGEVHLILPPHRRRYESNTSRQGYIEAAFNRATNYHLWNPADVGILIVPRDGQSPLNQEFVSLQRILKDLKKSNPRLRWYSGSRRHIDSPETLETVSRLLSSPVKPLLRHQIFGCPWSFAKLAD